jgi:hypothetical protein
MGNFTFIICAFYTNAIHWIEAHMMPCWFKSIFNVNCPGCGFQRSAIELLKGNIVLSFKLYPALIPLLFYIVFLFFDKKYQYKFSRKITLYGLTSIFITILISYIIKLNYQNF